MLVYVGHETSFDYQSEFYLPIKNSLLWQQHKIILPHEFDTKPFHTSEFIQNSDVFLAEVSYPSIGLGMELGWAENSRCRIICLHRTNTIPSTSLTVLKPEFIAYQNISTGKFDLIAMGKPFIANPDLLQRQRNNLSLHPYETSMLTTLY